MTDQIKAFLDRVQRAQDADLQRFGLMVVEDVAFDDEPITLAEARDHLRIDALDSGPSSADDVWLEAQIPAARQFCERFMGVSLAPRTLELATNAFPSIAVDTPPGACFTLRFGPVQSISSVKYLVEETLLDSAGEPLLDSSGEEVTEVTEQTLSAATYALDGYVTPNRLVLAYGESWPTDALNTHNSVKVRYTTGYVREAASPSFPVIPRMVRSAILLMLGHLYENREAVNVGNIITQFPLGVIELLSLAPDRERLGMA